MQTILLSPSYDGDDSDDEEVVVDLCMQCYDPLMMTMVIMMMAMAMVIIIMIMRMMMMLK